MAYSDQFNKDGYQWKKGDRLSAAQMNKIATVLDDVENEVVVHADLINNLTTQLQEVDSRLEDKIATANDVISGKADKGTTLEAYGIADAYTKDEAKAEVARQIAEVVAEAPEKFDTLKEIADWIGSDTVGATELSNKVSMHDVAITGLSSTKMDKATAESRFKDAESSIEANKKAIEDEATRAKEAESGLASDIKTLSDRVDDMGNTNHQELEAMEGRIDQALALKADQATVDEALALKAVKIDVDAAMQNLADAKQDVVEDLEEIRDGADLGSTAVQPDDLEECVIEGKVAETFKKVEDAITSLDGKVEDKATALGNAIGVEEARAKEEEEKIVKSVEDMGKDLQALDDVAVKYVESTQGRNHIILKNHDSILGTVANVKDSSLVAGSTYNLVMMSKWNVADFGSNKVHLNLNSVDEVTVNDEKHVALVEDVAEVMKGKQDVIGDLETIRSKAMSALQIYDIGNKADRGTTLASYGITDAYTKKETSDAIATAVAGIVADADADFDTLKEVADWIIGDKIGAVKLTSDVNSLLDRADGFDASVASLAAADEAQSTALEAAIQHSESTYETKDSAETRANTIQESCEDYTDGKVKTEQDRATKAEAELEQDIEDVDAKLSKDLKDLDEVAVKYVESVPGRNHVVLKNHDSILGTTTEVEGSSLSAGTTYNLVMLSKWNVADFGSNKVHLNLNSVDEVTVNDEKHVALVEDVASNLTDAMETKQDVIEDLEEIRSLAKSALQEHQDISGKADKETVAADIADAVAPLATKAAVAHVEGLLEREQYRAEEVEEAIAAKVNALDEVAVKYVESAPGRNHVILKNHDSILGTATEVEGSPLTSGSTYNLVMMSKWNVADFGSGSVHLNLNSVDGITVNDNKHVALMEDIASALDLSAKLDAKQDVIEDLETIRSGSALGATAVQPSVLEAYATKNDLSEAVADGISSIVDGADEKFDTLKEIAEWIATDTTNAADLATSISALKSQAEAFDVSIGSLQGEVAAIKSSDEAVEGRVGILETDVSGLKNGVASINSTIDTLATKKEVTNEEVRATSAEDVINKSIKALDDVVVKYVESTPGRNHIVLKNHDSILGTATEVEGSPLTSGSTYNLVMMSKWNAADFGSGSVHLNLNSVDGVTINDSKPEEGGTIALIKDIDAAIANAMGGVNTSLDGKQDVIEDLNEIRSLVNSALQEHQSIEHLASIAYVDETKDAIEVAFAEDIKGVEQRLENDYITRVEIDETLGGYAKVESIPSIGGLITAADADAKYAIKSAVDDLKVAVDACVKTSDMPEHFDNYEAMYGVVNDHATALSDISASLDSKLEAKDLPDFDAFALKSDLDLDSLATKDDVSTAVADKVTSDAVSAAIEAAQSAIEAKFAATIEAMQKQIDALTARVIVAEAGMKLGESVNMETLKVVEASDITSMVEEMPETQTAISLAAETVIIGGGEVDGKTLNVTIQQ